MTDQDTGHEDHTHGGPRPHRQPWPPRAVHLRRWQRHRLVRAVGDIEPGTAQGVLRGRREGLSCCLVQVSGEPRAQSRTAPAEPGRVLPLGTEPGQPRPGPQRGGAARPTSGGAGDDRGDRGGVPRGGTGGLPAAGGARSRRRADQRRQGGTRQPSAAGTRGWWGLGAIRAPTAYEHGGLLSGTDPSVRRGGNGHRGLRPPRPPRRRRRGDRRRASRGHRPQRWTPTAARTPCRGRRPGRRPTTPGSSLFTAAVDDLRHLLLRDPEDPTDVFAAAGTPWYLTLFGRDSLWTARMMLPFGTELAAGTLRALARRQGRTVDDSRAGARQDPPRAAPHGLPRPGERSRAAAGLLRHRRRDRPVGHPPR